MKVSVSGDMPHVPLKLVSSARPARATRSTATKRHAPRTNWKEGANVAAGRGAAAHERKVRRMITSVRLERSRVTTAIGQRTGTLW
jgi:hypothetical protein